jgi:hypothetical protein
MNVTPVTDIVRALLATLPKCKDCNEPAPRWFMTERIPIPESGVHFRIERGVIFLPEQYTGPSGGFQNFKPKTYRWQWDCCDHHAMPGAELTRDYPLAETIRDARLVLSARPE